MRENRMKSLTLNEIVADLEQKEVRRETMEHCLQRENKQLRTVISVKERVSSEVGVMGCNKYETTVG